MKPLFYFKCKKILFFLPFFLVVEVASAKYSVEGEVFDLDGEKRKRFDFIQEREVSGDLITDTIVYRRQGSDEKVVEEKLVHSGGGLVSYWIKQHQREREAKVYAENNKIHFYHKDLKTNEEKRKQIERPPKFVVGPLIVAFIESHWDSLVSGNEITFTMGLWGRQKTYEFNLVPEVKKDHLLIEMKPESFWVRQFVDPIKLKFARATQKVVSYRGRTSIVEEEAGDWDDLNAEINYKHHTEK